ncbi:TPA: hypothetical protein ACKP1B_003733 [Serratia fonticola]
MILKNSILSALLLNAILHSGFSVAQEQPAPDVYSVIERQLEHSVPLATNTSADDLSPWFDLYNYILVHNSPQRAYELLKKLNFKTDSALESLSLSASWTVENYGIDKGTLILSQIGLDKPASLSSYENFVNYWIKAKQPEKALQFISLDESAKSHYLPTVLAAYKDTPEKSVAIYNDSFKDSDKEYFQQYNMLVTIAENFRDKGDKENTELYTDLSLAMLNKAIATGARQTRSSHYQHLLAPMNLYAFSGNKEKMLKTAQSVLKETGSKGYNYDSVLPDMLVFYKNNGLTNEYNTHLALNIAAIDKTFGFAPSFYEEEKLIRLLNELNESNLMGERLDKFINATEYACYNNRYCYAYKVDTLKYLYARKQEALAGKYLNIIIEGSQEQSFSDWQAATTSIVEKLVSIGRLDEAKQLTIEAESIYLSTLKGLPPEDVERDYINLAEMYGNVGDAAAAQRVLNEQGVSFHNNIVIDIYIKNKQWSKARELAEKDKWLPIKNQALLKNVCTQNTPECMQYITLTLSKLAAQTSYVQVDTVGNLQLYQIGAIYHSLGIKPTAEQQQLIQQLYDKASPEDASSPTKNSV